MNRHFLSTLLVTTSLLTCSMAVTAQTVVNLDAPGVLEELKTSRPKHYRQVTEILQYAGHMQEKNIASWLRTNYRAEGVSIGPVLLVSLPPKRRLSFALDAIHYKSVVTVNVSNAKLVPAK